MTALYGSNSIPIIDLPLSRITSERAALPHCSPELPHCIASHRSSASHANEEDEFVVFWPQHVSYRPVTTSIRIVSSLRFERAWLHQRTSKIQLATANLMVIQIVVIAAAEGKPGVCIPFVASEILTPPECIPDPSGTSPRSPRTRDVYPRQNSQHRQTPLHHFQFLSYGHEFGVFGILILRRIQIWCHLISMTISG